MERFFLKHKDDICGIAAIDIGTGQLISFENIDPARAPFLGNATQENMRKWWSIRAVPGTRKTMEQVLRDNDCLNNEAYLVKNLGLSLVDSYWICPLDMQIKWDDINLYEQGRYYNHKMPYHNATSYDPNASLGGQMDKYWDMSQDTPVLVKTASAYGGQQAINEVFATTFHKALQNEVSYVEYMIRKRTVDNSMQCLCNSFTSKQIEFVSAFEIIESQKRRNDKSLCETFIEACVDNGIARHVIQDYMDYQIITDFIISNTDEHLLNFGVLRDADSMELIGPAPIFDSGNSMFYSDERLFPYTRVELLAKKITAFHDKEEKMLAHVKNPNVVDLDKALTGEEVEQFYRVHGISKEKAAFISENYLTKLDMIKDLQNGKKISLFNEKH